VSLAEAAGIGDLTVATSIDAFAGIVS
jgi:hypothetical protein